MYLRVPRGREEGAGGGLSAQRRGDSGLLPASWPGACSFLSPGPGLPAGSRAAFLPVVQGALASMLFSLLKGKTLAYCIPVVQSLQAMKTKIQVSVSVSPLFTVREKASGGSTAAVLGPKTAPLRSFLTSSIHFPHSTLPEDVPAHGRGTVFPVSRVGLTGTCVRCSRMSDTVPDALPV